MSNSLFNLIKTLNKAEKRVFSENVKKTKRKNYYSKLLTIYASSESYSKELDQKVFKNESQKFVSDCKRQLRDSLYQLLVSLEKNKSVQYRIEQLLKTSIMLFERKQYSESKKMIDKVEKLAIKYEAHDFLIPIKTHKIRMVMNHGLRVGEHDMKYIKSLLEDKRKTIEHCTNYHIANDGFVHSAIEQFFVNKLSLNKKGKEKLGKDEYKGVSTKLRKLQQQVNISMLTPTFENNDKLVKDLRLILDLVDQNKEVVMEAKLLGLNYPNYLTNYLARVDRSTINPETFFKKYDDVKTNSIYQTCTLLENKTHATCFYAMSLYKPELAIDQLEFRKIFYTKNKISIFKNIKIAEVYVYIYFALKKWDICLEYLDEIEANSRSMFQKSVLTSMKAICIYEKGESQYFKSLVTAYISKRRKNGIQLSNRENIADCLLLFLYYMSIESDKKMSELIKDIYNSFDYYNSPVLYIVSWIICKFPALYNDDYLAFLEKNKIQHFDFETIENKMK